jgi:hypothetical protein
MAAHATRCLQMRIVNYALLPAHQYRKGHAAAHSVKARVHALVVGRVLLDPLGDLRHIKFPGVIVPWVPLEEDHLICPALKSENDALVALLCTNGLPRWSIVQSG